VQLPIRLAGRPGGRPAAQAGHNRPVPFTVVSFHAHPDDEALLTAGTLARAVAEGHRVVLVSATAGEAGLAAAAQSGGAGLAARREAELRRAAEYLGAARVELLGYGDSGLDGQAGGAGSFVHADIDTAAARLARLLAEEHADVLTSYDAAGGYGHPDHRQVHAVGRRAAAMAGTRVVLEATVDRRLIRRAARLVSWLPGIPPEFSPSRFETAYSSSAAITHCVDVQHFAVAKRAAMAGHVSQGTADEGTRSLAVFMRLPMPLFRLAFGREWFIEVGRRPGRPLDDIFASLRGDHGPRCRGLP